MMCVIDDIEELKQLFFVFSYVTLLALTSYLEGSFMSWYTPQENLIGDNLY